MSDFTPDNISYINKDFESIYEELLELVPKLTNKWDPSLSNESDPLVVLLKLNALLADKNNYNIDKNILELFPSSVTQRGNAQKIYESLGYNIRYYQSALVIVYMKWTGDTLGKDVKLVGDSDDGDVNTSYFIELTDDSGEVVYTIIPAFAGLTNYSSTLTLPSDGTSISAWAMEGTIHDYEIDGDTIITLSNIDSNLRLYFTESMIAENGIFIKNEGETDWTEWERVDNLESTELGNKNYKFGVVPNSNTCYIEFPQDIANLIGQGLNIKYIISSGSSGVITSNILDSFYSDVTANVTYKSDEGTSSEAEATVINDSVKIWNPSASIGGKDPESLDDAYLSFQKVVNTFNTLVTCKDYENAIFNLEDEYTLIPTVSNCVVADRTNDITSTVKIRSLTLDGDKIIYKVSTNIPMYAYNLKFYLLNYESSILTSSQYNNTFKTSTSLLANVDKGIEDYKAIQHDLIDVLAVKEKNGTTLINANEGDDNSNYSNPLSGAGIDRDLYPYIFKNKYDINCQIITYNKVSTTEITEIKQNVALALYQNFDARHVEFGESVSYDYLKEVILDADKRIKDIILNEPTYTTYYLDVISSEDKPLLENEDLSNDVKAKNILAGVSQGITFDDTFNYDLGQENGEVYPTIDGNYIHYITTHTSVNIPTGDVGYPLKDNESVTFYSPNLIADTTYSYYLYYKTSMDLNGSVYVDGDYFELLAPLELYQSATNSNDSTTYSSLQATIPSGTIISLSGFRTSSTKTISNYGSLGADKTITTYTTNSQTIPYTNSSKHYIKCYWILNNVTNDLSEALSETSSGYELFLNNGEYFLYTDSSQSSLYILGPGTTINFSCSSINDNGLVAVNESTNLTSKNLVASTISSIESISEEDISSINWLTLQLSGNDANVEVTENQLVTLGYGTTIYNTSTKDYDLRYYNSGINALTVEGISYVDSTTSSDKTSLPKAPNNGWRAFSSLNLLGYKDYPMNLYEDQSLDLDEYTEAGVHVEDLETIKGSGSTDNDCLKLQFSDAISLPGGTKIPVGIYNDSLEPEYTLKIYAYTNALDSDGNLVVNRYGDYIPISLSNYEEVSLTETEFNAGTYYTYNSSDGIYTKADTFNASTTYFKKSTDKNSITYTLPKGDFLIPILWQSASGDKLNISAGTGETLSLYNNSKADISSILPYTSAYYLKAIVSDADVSITFTLTDGDNAYGGSLNIGNLYVIGEDIDANVLTKMNVLDPIDKTTVDDETYYTGSLFDYTYEVDDDINISDSLDSSSFFNEYHVMNRFTIPQINLINLNITSSSKL